MARRGLALAVFLPALAADPVAAACISDGAIEVPGLRADGPLTLGAADGRRFRLVALQGGAEIAPVAGLRLVPLGPADRHGRIPAQGFVGANPLESALLADGRARLTTSRLVTRDCRQQFEIMENAAIAGRLGLWAAPGAVLAADDSAGLKAAEGRFSIIQGRVRSVRSQGRITYVNFGGPGSGALTVTIFDRDMAAFRESGLEPAAFQGQILRVRGIVTIRRGPFVAAAIPEVLTIAQSHTRGTR